MMSEEDFFYRFQKTLENIKDEYEFESIHDALIVWFGENYLFLDSEYLLDRIVKDRRAEGIDSILIDEKNYNLLFIQSKTVDEFKNTGNNLPENDVKLTLSGVEFLLKGKYKDKITPELENLIDEYHDWDQTGDYKTEINFITLKKKPIDMKYIENFKREFPEIEIRILDFKWFMEFYMNEYLVRRAPPPKKLSFKVIKNILIKNEPYKSRMFTIRAEEIARAYDEHKEKIFQQNVRYFLGIRSRSINQQIYETAVGGGSKCFWYFNNGITMICKKINEAASGKVVNLESAQIINGAQTTYAIYKAYIEGKLKEDSEILLRVVETTDEKFTEKITLFTNSQNAIKMRDLCSNDNIQIKIQTVLSKTYKYFYERKRGEFNSIYHTDSERKKAYGKDYKNKIISNENTAQAFLAFYLDKPAQAKSEKKRIFVKDEHGFYSEIFNENDELLPEKLLLTWKLLKFIEEHKKSYRKQYRSAEELPDNEKKEIYKYDFILHSEYFILSVFKDFLLDEGFEIESDQEDILEVVKLIDSINEEVVSIYNEIKDGMAIFINEIKSQPGYYHNKFFKSEKSIGLVRNHFKRKYSFVNVL